MNKSRCCFRGVEDPDLPISSYNYTAIRDRLKAERIKVSVTTIIDRAKKLDCHKPRRKRRVHDREVVTASIGALIQHDASTHLWCPQAQEKWTLITSIDDYSRKLLFADFFRSESTWAHIQATQALMQEYGLPLLSWPKNAIRAGISPSAPLPLLGDPQKSGSITIFTHLRPVLLG